MARKTGWVNACAAALLVATAARADEATVPAALQSKLLARAANYDRNFSKRAPAQAHIFVVLSSGASAAQFSGQLRQALGEEPTVGGVPHDEEEVPFTSSAALAAKVKADKPAVLFLGWVSAGVALGFDLISGKPRLLVNLKQAQKQGVAFGADLLRLAQVVDP
jgi:YfiR/HmsC-like